MCLTYIIVCVKPLQVVVLLYNLLYNTLQRIVVQYLQFKPNLSFYSIKHKNSGDVAGTANKYQLLQCTSVPSSYCTIKIKNKKNILFIFYICFQCIICVKCIINLSKYSTIQLFVLVRLNFLDLTNKIGPNEHMLRTCHMQETYYNIKIYTSNFLSQTVYYQHDIFFRGVIQFIFGFKILKEIINDNSNLLHFQITTL